MPKILRSLFVQVVIGLVLGIIVGLVWPDFGKQLSPLAKDFIQLIKMMVGPIVFCVVTNGIAKSGDLRKVGRLGGLTLIYFEIITTIALLFGMLVAYVVEPGAGMHVSAEMLKAMGEPPAAAHQSLGSVVDFLQRLLPKTLLSPFVEGDVLQILLLAILTGVTLILLGKPGKEIGNVIESASHLFFRILGLFIRLAPIGVLGAVAFTTSTFGLESLQKIAMLLVTYFVSCIVFIAVFFALLMRLCGFSLLRLIRYMREELTIVAATTSSDAVLPQSMVKLEDLGVHKSTVGLVFPTGYSFNLDGFSLYLTLAVLFIAQATDTDLTAAQTVSILLVALLTSKGAHGVPGSAIVILAATLSSVPALPLSGLMLLLPADWFVGIARALTNYLGNCVGTIVMGKITGTIDSDRVKAKLLAGPDEVTPIGADAKAT